MSKATKCDRCGGFYEQGGKKVYQGWNMSVEYDLCPDCAESFDAWLERGQMADATNKSNSQFDVLKTAETAKNATSKNEIHNFNDSREQLESDAQKFAQVYYADHLLVYDKVIELLDRQAAITERDMLDEMQHVFVPDPADITMRDERIAELQREIATLKEHRAANMEKLHELTDECAELRKYRDEWRGLAEKYRADSIAAQAETERYRAKLGDVLDALHEAERAAR